MRESIVVICPTPQARRRAADWRDGQFAHGVYAGIARRAKCARSVGRIVIRRLDRQDGGLRLRLQSALRARCGVMFRA